jgi:DNA-binding LacI/PurR family transcriptional regulator
MRLAAFKEEMGESFDEGLVEGGEGWTAESGFVAATRLFERGSGMTALFCANDLLAIGALSALAAKGLRAPADLSVVGFDDSELARHASPPLTTMRIYSRDMARSAARRVLERIEDPGLPPVKLEFPIDIVTRSSSKAVPGA